MAVFVFYPRGDVTRPIRVQPSVPEAAFERACVHVSVFLLFPSSSQTPNTTRRFFAEQDIHDDKRRKEAEALDGYH